MAVKADAQVRLGVDDKTKAGLQSAQRNMRNMSKAASKMGQTMSVAFGNVLARGITLAIGATKRLATETGNLQDRIHKLNIATKLSVETLSVLRHAAGLAGTDFETLAGTFRSIAHNAVAASKGLEEKARDFRLLGIDVNKFLQLNSDEKLFEFVEALSRIEDQALKLNLAQNIAGGGGMALLQAFEDGKMSMDEFRASAEKFGVVLSDDMTKKTAEAKDQVHLLKEAFRGLAIDLQNTVDPAIQNTAGGLARLITRLRSADKEHELGLLKARRNRLDREIFEGTAFEGAETWAYLLDERIKQMEAELKGETSAAGGDFKSLTTRTTLEEEAQKGGKAKGDGLSAALRSRKPQAADYAAQLNMKERTKRAEEMTTALRSQKSAVIELRDEFKQLKFAVEGWGQSFADRLLDGERNFKGFVDSLLREMIRYQLTMQSNKLFGILGDFLANAAQGFFTGRSSMALGSSRAGYGGKFGFGGGGGGVGATRAGYGPKYGFAGGVHYVPMDMWAKVHKGEKIVPAGNSGGGSGGAMITINNYSRGNVEAQSQATETGQQIIDVAVYDSVNRLTSRGRLDGAFRTNYGLGRAGKQVG